MTRGIKVVFYLLLALIALVWACSYLAVASAGAVITRLLIASAVALAAWWVIRDIREID
jgi:hypothetical protein